MVHQFANARRFGETSRLDRKRICRRTSMGACGSQHELPTQPRRWFSRTAAPADNAKRSNSPCLHKNAGAKLRNRDEPPLQIIVHRRRARRDSLLSTDKRISAPWPPTAGNCSGAKITSISVATARSSASAPSAVMQHLQNHARFWRHHNIAKSARVRAMCHRYRAAALSDPCRAQSRLERVTYRPPILPGIFSHTTIHCYSCAASDARTSQ